MTTRFGELRSWRLAGLFAVASVILASSLGGAFIVPGPTAAGMMQTREGDALAIGTPVAPAAEPHDPPANESPADSARDGDPLDGDPLDGDPRDGKPPRRDPDAPLDQTQLEIVRSGRPNDAPSSVLAYDGDPETSWAPRAGSNETWLWLDLGAERRLREVRWLAEGTGTVEIAVSSDRQRWRDVDRVDVESGWQGITLRDDARYVRLALLPNDGELPAIAETAVFGPDRAETVSSQQKAADGGERKRDRRDRADNRSASEQQADEDSSRSKEGRNESRSNDRVRVSAEEGETRCSGNRERCEARQGDVSVEEDCEQEGSCTIDVHADGGTAICDASGGDQTETGDGEGKRGGRGGRCEAVADGGAVTIGDINP